MGKRNWLPKRLSTQLVAILVGLVVLTSTAIGVPAIWLINRQMDAQFWERIEQAQTASRALLDSKGRDMEGLAQLTAQRPTLMQLLRKGEGSSLQEYLETLRVGAGLDLLVICGRSNSVRAASSSEGWERICALPGASRTMFMSDEQTSTILMYASSVIQNGDGNLGEIVVGEFIDHEFARSLCEQTGLEHTFLLGDQVVASSMELDQDYVGSTTGEAETALFDQDHRFKLTLGGETYFAVRMPVEGTELIRDVALSAAALVETRRRLEWGWLGGMGIVMLLGSVVGLLLARRIGVTFDDLAEAAVALREGDLETPVHIDADLEEAVSVAQALESARQALKTSLLRLRQEKEWSDQLLDSIVEGIVILNQDHRITFFSPGAERITGWSKERVLMQSCDRFFKPLESEKMFSQLLPSPGTQTVLNVEMAGGRKSSLAVSVADFNPTSGGTRSTLLVFRDVSEEQAIHRLMGHFIANVSHEFRTPLSAVAASTELLMDQVDDLTSSELHELLGALHIGILKLSSLVDNLIESASIEAGHFRVTPRAVDLGEIIGEAVQTMRPLLDKHQQRLEIELPIEPPIVLADPRRVIQVFTNLLSNASKFGPSGSIIRILAERRDDMVRIEIYDQGPGVAREYRDYIFQRFASVPQDDSLAGYGVGLGLSVVKAIVTAGGGEVGVKENPAGGAIFWFTLAEVKST
jgi:PAS domain S-box-containing protein